MSFERLGDIALGTLAVCAVAMTALLVRRELKPSAPSQVTRAVSRAPVALANWADYAEGGSWYGDSKAPITIVEFSDFQCPFCARLARSIDSVRHARPGAIKVSFRHFPLTAIHAQAYPAALAAECARAQGRFADMHDAMFQHQASLGTMTWMALASEAGVRDSAKFSRCIQHAEFAQRVKNDMELGNRLRVTGTPTVIIDGLLWGVPPTAQQIDSIVSSKARTQTAGR